MSAISDCLVSNVDLCMFQLEQGKEYTFHAPTQSPIDPPYKQACLLKKSDRLAKESNRIQHSDDTEKLTGDTCTSACDTLHMLRPTPVTVDDTGYAGHDKVTSSDTVDSQLLDPLHAVSLH